jgi:ABC-type bacteriocin/lantibiotic exporter with double-glycine peptidase domain
MESIATNLDVFGRAKVSQECDPRREVRAALTWLAKQAKCHAPAGERHAALELARSRVHSCVAQVAEAANRVGIHVVVPRIAWAEITAQHLPLVTFDQDGQAVVVEHAGSKLALNAVYVSRLVKGSKRKVQLAALAEALGADASDSAVVLRAAALQTAAMHSPSGGGASPLQRLLFSTGSWAGCFRSLRRSRSSSW